jgi:hypothetical protein
MSWIFLSKSKKDEYINMFAKGCQTKVTDPDEFNYDASSPRPIILRGILKKKIIQRCWKEGRTFYYMDTGYFGNHATSSNPHGWKIYHRIVKNNLQHNEIKDRPVDRWQKLNIPIKPWKKGGSKILIAAPDEKPCKFYGIDKDTWVEQTITQLKDYTDRPVIVRDRAKSRLQREVHDTLKSALSDDVFALVTYNSVAATESVLFGVPAFVLAPSNAALPVSRSDLSFIEDPYYPDDDIRHKWACHLSYGQFHISEIKSGTAKKMLEDYE